MLRRVLGKGDLMVIAARRIALLLALALPLALGAVQASRAPKAVEKNAERKGAEGFAQLRALALPDNPATAWPGIQFIQADKQGRAYLLRGDTLDLFALTSAGRLVPRGQLEGAEAQDEKGGSVDTASLSPAGDVWVTYRTPNRLEVFRGGQSELRLESKWLVSSLAADDGPVVGVLPGELDLVTGEAPQLAAPPLIKKWDGKRWETLVDGAVPDERETTGASPMESLRGQFGTLIALAPNGQLWVADRNAYRLRRFTASGLLKDELRVGKGEVVWAERSEEDYAHLEKSSAAVGFTFDRKKVSPVVARPLYRAMTVGRDGLVYLICETNDGLALDRFDPSYPAYDRVLLAGVTLAPGRITLAAGAHSLILAPRLAKDGIWEVPEEALQDADWREVPEASVNGTPIPPREPKPAPTGAPAGN
ncbi:MAG: hypothetical protein ABJC13_21120 [Acidobacteriota bacterium]